MSRSSGAGSPVWFKCPVERSRNAGRKLPKYPEQPHHVVRTGRERPYKPKRYCALGARSTSISREYICVTCRHRGWSNHMDLVDMAEIAKPSNEEFADHLIKTMTKGVKATMNKRARLPKGLSR